MILRKALLLQQNDLIFLANEHRASHRVISRQMVCDRHGETDYVGVIVQMLEMTTNEELILHKEDLIRVAVSTSAVIPPEPMSIPEWARSSKEKCDDA
jgi:hypothetical protein